MNLSNLKFQEISEENTPEGKGVLILDEYIYRYKKNTEKILDLKEEKIPNINFFNKYGEVEGKKFNKYLNLLDKYDFDKNLKETDFFVNNIFENYLNLGFHSDNNLDQISDGGLEYFKILDLIKKNSKNHILIEKINIFINTILHDINSTIDILNENFDYFLEEYSEKYLNNLKEELLRILNNFGEINKHNLIDIYNFQEGKYKEQLFNNIFDKNLNTDGIDIFLNRNYEYFLEDFIPYNDEEKDEITKKISGITFKNLKNKGVNSLQDLEKIGIDYKKFTLKDLNIFHKEKIKREIIFLYKDNYDEKKYGNFLEEIKLGLGKIFDSKEEVEFEMFYIDGKPILSSYFKKIENGDLYFGGFNGFGGFHSYGFGFWVLKKILENKNENIIAGILTKIDGKNNELYNKLQKKYEEFGFYYDNSGIHKFGKNSEYIQIYKEISSKEFEKENIS